MIEGNNISLFLEEQSSLKEKPASFFLKSKAKLIGNKATVLSIYSLLGLLVLALFAPILANEKPLYANYKGNILFPAFSFQSNYEIELPNEEIEILNPNTTDWKRMNLESVVWAPVVYSPGKSEKNNRYLNAYYTAPNANQYFKTKGGEEVNLPARFKHWLGTGKTGEDLLADLIHGTRVSILIGVCSMGIAALIGLLLGVLSGYFGNKKLTVTRGVYWSVIVGLPFAFFYGFSIRSFTLQDALAKSGWQFVLQFFLSFAIAIGVIFIFGFLGKLISRISFLQKQIGVPIDTIVVKTMEVLTSIPKLVLIITVAAIITQPSLTVLILIIAFTSWTGIARLTRAEILKTRELNYIEAANSIGLTHWRIMKKHILPNSIAPALVAISFGVANAILIESGLSFLGIGVPDDVVTWGKLLAAGKQNFNAWWLVVFPGLAIFLTVTAFNLVGDGLRDAVDVKG